MAARTLARTAGSAVALLFVQQVAAAESVPEPVRIAVSAPEGRVDSTSFLEQIRVRAPHARLASEDERSRYFGVFINEVDEHANGTLVIAEAEGRPSSRNIQGASCKEVASALALIAALALDPGAQVESTRQDAKKSSKGTRSQPMRAPVLNLRTSASECLECSTPVRRTPSASSRAVQLNVIGGGGLSGAVAPGALPETMVSLELQAARKAPALSLGALRTASWTFARDDLRANLYLTAAQLRFCPVALALPSSFGLRPCGMLQVGVVSLKETAPGYQSNQDQLWAAYGLLAGMRWQPETSVVGLQGDVGVIAPLTRDTYSWRDGVRAHTVPWIGFVGSVELVFRIL